MLHPADRSAGSGAAEAARVASAYRSAALSCLSIIHTTHEDWRLNMAKKAKDCTRKKITFKTKRGKTISFSGRQGAGCGPRPKPKTGHLSVFKKAMASAARSCKGKPRRAFLNCVASGMPK